MLAEAGAFLYTSGKLRQTGDMWRRARVVVLVLAVLGAVPRAVRAQPVGADPFADDADVPPSFPDPIEPLNRLTFRLNLKIDRWVFDPITRTYARAVPAPGRQAVRRVLANLNAPVVFVNDVLQIEPSDAAITATRFLINTTIGLLGLFDVAARGGLPAHASDFGQTLALCGVPSGPYLIIPLAGPTTMRDGAGYLVDFVFRPYAYFLGPGVLLFATPIYEGSAGISAREEHAEELRALESSAMDYYAALRNAYTQDRTARIWARREGRGPLALAKRVLRALTPGTAGGEVGDTVAHGGDEHLEAVSREH